MFGKAIVTAYANLKLERWTETKLQDGFQGRIQTGSKGSHKPVKHFRFLKQSIEINYQIHDYKNFRLSQVKLRKFLKKIERLDASSFPISAAPFLHFRCPGSTVRPILFASWLEDASELSR